MLGYLANNLSQHYNTVQLIKKHIFFLYRNNIRTFQLTLSLFSGKKT